jgi:hypothetical protein
MIDQLGNWLRQRRGEAFRCARRRWCRVLKMALNYTVDIGCEYGGGANCTRGPNKGAS